ncbi:hypothetical protein C9994_16875 [Marivirga lumbricoides]|uniref:Uncharacterized protein n=1 Tax=Marivirga lumbricoides TaxID=1046115 RepID=A0A2T4DAB2_9BACT|nr:hypothetical protein C9994_16875 [Marivirga lumbricoides]
MFFVYYCLNLITNLKDISDYKYFISFKYSGNSSFKRSIQLSLTFVFLQILSNFANQFKPKRVKDCSCKIY